MIDTPQLNVTPTTSAPFVRRVLGRDLSGTPYPEVPQATTSTFVGNVYTFYKSGDPPSGRSSWTVGSAASVLPPSDGPSARLEVVAADRVRMLATKYEDHASAEDLARLEILTARLSHLAPRTTAADIAKVEQTVDLIEEIDASLSALAAEYDN